MINGDSCASILSFFVKYAVGVYGREAVLVVAFFYEKKPRAQQRPYALHSILYYSICSVCIRTEHQIKTAAIADTAARPCRQSKPIVLRSESKQSNSNELHVQHGTRTHHLI